MLPTLAQFEVTTPDAQLAAAHDVVVVTTLGYQVNQRTLDAITRSRFDSLARHNLGVLRNAGVRLAIGSDNYRDDSKREVDYLRDLAVFAPRELLRLYSEETPRAIFPGRRVGCLEEGCEGSFLVLDRDPTFDAAAFHSIRIRVKDGRVLSS